MTSQMIEKQILPGIPEENQKTRKRNKLILLFILN